MKNFNPDELMDAIDDMNDMAQETDEIAQLLNDQNDFDINGDIDEELANLENELDVQKMLETNNTKNINMQGV